MTERFGMDKSPFAVFVSALLLLTGCSSTRSTGPEFIQRTNAAEHITLRTTGNPGQPFTAHLKVDGIEREWSGVSPAELPLRVCVLEGTVQKPRNSNLSFEIIKPKATLGFSPFGTSCHFRYHDGGIEVWSR